MLGNITTDNYPPIAAFLYGHSDGIGVSFERNYGTTQEYANNYNTAAKGTFIRILAYIAGVYDASASTAVIYLDGSSIGTHNLIPQNTSRTTTSYVR